MDNDYLNFLERMGSSQMRLGDDELQDELKHYGVKGMKWGVRKDRIGKAMDKKGPQLQTISRESAKAANTSAEGLRKVGNRGRLNKTQTSNMKQMSDQDLRDKINRMNMERQYTQMISSESKLNRGKDAATNTLQVAGTVLSIGASAVSIALAIRELKK